MCGPDFGGGGFIEYRISGFASAARTEPAAADAASEVRKVRREVLRRLFTGGRNAFVGPILVQSFRVIRAEWMSPYSSPVELLIWAHRATSVPSGNSVKLG